ncbi:MAG TPA: M28 family peptidase [Deltaproteobacteria bacterium]|nr:M28 family peptidase [Deltaproteobacteria bacterium]
MIDVKKTKRRLEQHLRALTVDIGERSVCYPDNLAMAADYIENFYREIGLPVEREPYDFRKQEVANIVAYAGERTNFIQNYIVGAHYDSVAGTVGADDNASAVAVQLETARELKKLFSKKLSRTRIKFVSFALEEPPAFGTRYMGSKVHARRCKKARESLDGMLCLEMVGYTCHEPGCQKYPFPLMFMDFPKIGNYIGIVGNLRSKPLTESLYRAFTKNPNLPVVKLTVPLGGYTLPSVGLSDHSSFWHQGYRAVMITDTAFYRNPYYHKVSDTMEKLDFDFMTELVRSLIIFFEEKS